MKRHRFTITAILLSSIMAVSGFLPMAALQTFAAEQEQTADDTEAAGETTDDTEAVGEAAEETADAAEEADAAATADPAAAEAADPDAIPADAEVTGTIGGSMVTLDDIDEDMTDEELVEGYIEQELGILDSHAKYRKAKTGSRLKGINKMLYDSISGQLADVAAGKRSSTTFVTALTKKSWTAAELGVSKILERDPKTSELKVTDEAMDALYNARKTILALLGDYPYELYWFNKTTGFDDVKFSYNANSSRIAITSDEALTISLPVLKEYRAGKFEVDTSTGAAVRAAVGNADSILARYSAASDYNKLYGYCTEICDLVAYNSTAMTDFDTYGELNMSGENKVYGNPWQLVWVFDGDDSTTVVCEGYSKAFQYLCDKTDFASSDICCVCMSGILGKNTPHMWNMVTMDDGLNYLVDVTNCDEGTVGAPDKLFLAGVKGSPKGGYFFSLGLYNNATYGYLDDMFNMYSTGELTLADHYYGKKSIAGAKVTLLDGNCVYDGTRKTPAIKVVDGDKELVEGTDYTVEYGKATKADPALNIGPGADAGVFVLQGIGDYDNAILASFDIKKNPAFSVNPAELTLNVGDWVSYTADEPVSEAGHETVQLIGIMGELYIRSDDAAVAKVSTAQDKPGWIQAVSAGTATVTLTSDETDEYWAATTPLKIKVRECDLSSDACKVTMKTSSAVYTGSELKPAVTVTYNGVALKAGTDYSVEYSNNVNVGTAAVTVKAVEGKTTGSVSKTFKITPAPQTLTVKKGSKAIEKGGTVAVAPGQTLKLTVAGAQGNLAVKSAASAYASAAVSGDTITVKGVKFGTSKLTISAAATDNYSAGSTEITVNVVPAATTKLTAVNMVTGMKLTWAKVSGATGYVLYRSDGKKTVVVTTINSGSTLTYIDKAANTNGIRYTFAVKAKKGNEISPLVTRTYHYRLIRPSLTSVRSKAAGKMTAVWSKNTSADGYEIQYSTRKTFAYPKAIRITKGTTGGKTFDGFTKGKTYYVRVRSYKMDGTAKHYSLWSTSKTVTIAK